MLDCLVETGEANCAERGGLLCYSVRGTDEDGQPTVWLVQVQDAGTDGFDVADDTLWGLDAG